MIVSTAKAYNATLLTEDITLKKILKRVDELTELKILTWNQVISTL